MLWLKVFTIIFTALLPLINADDPCRFEDPSRGVVDLTSIARTDGQPSYTDIMLTMGTIYRMLNDSHHTIHYIITLHCRI